MRIIHASSCTDHIGRDTKDCKRRSVAANLLQRTMISPLPANPQAAIIFTDRASSEYDLLKSGLFQRHWFKSDWFKSDWFKPWVSIPEQTANNGGGGWRC
jgi:hypothetical protein